MARKQREVIIYSENPAYVKLSMSGRVQYRMFYNQEYGLKVVPKPKMKMSETKLSLIFGNNPKYFSMMSSDEIAAFELAL